MQYISDARTHECQTYISPYCGIKIENIEEKSEHKWSSLAGNSSKGSKEGSSGGNSDSGRLCKGQLSRIHICKGQFWQTALHLHCVVPTACVQLCNHHSTYLCLKSSNFSKRYFEGTRTTDVTLHGTTDSAIYCVITCVCIIGCFVYRRRIGNRRRLFIYEYKQNS